MENKNSLLKAYTQNEQVDPENHECEVLTTNELVQYQQKMIDEVSSLLELPSNMIHILLHHYKWDREQLLEKYFDGNTTQFFRDAHVVNPFNNDKQEVVHRKLPAECSICFSVTTPDLMSGLACGHCFCLNCWREYLTMKIEAEGLAQSICCPAHDCDIIVDDITVSKLVSGQSLAKYQQLTINNFVASNRRLRWCPSPDCNCTHFITATSVDSYPVSCKCGVEFCFGCGEMFHAPIECCVYNKWFQRFDENFETITWIIRNTKQCPRCKVPIEKIGGCNHMTCISKDCRHEFCWICLGPWESHGSNLYNCHHYDDAEAKAARDAQAEQRFSMTRYVHYCKRFIKHALSFKNATKMYMAKSNAVNKLVEQSAPWSDHEYQLKAATVLTNCRRTLMSSCAFSYYLKKNNQSMIFETNLQYFELATNKLAKLLAQKDLHNIRNLLRYHTEFCHNRRLALLNHAEEGCENGWWEYLE